MAVGDIKKIGTLQINEVKYEQSQIIECAINTNFTFVDDSTGNYDWEWIEANLNGTKAYISKASPLHGMSPNNMLGQCKKVTLGGILYRIALISANDWINLPKTVLAKMLKIGAFDFDVTTSDFFYKTGMDRDEVRIVTLKFDYVIDNGSFPANSAGQNLYYWPVLIVDNNVPIISGEDENLGNKTSSFNITYSVSDTDAGQELTVKEKLNGGPVKLVANLPYYITTPIIMGLFESHVPLESITVMVQKEVADRMQSGPGTKDYGALSLAVQFYSKAEIVANVPANCFMPRPNVGSAVIRLTCHAERPVDVKDEAFMFKIIRASFNQRRKTLQNGLNNASNLSVNKEQVVTALEKMGLPATVRGEALSLEQFAELSNLLKA